MSLRIGDLAPDFTQQSTEGPISFHAWCEGHWAVLYSHPRDFTPVCTTELGATAKLREAFARRGVKVLAVSVDDLDSHQRWVHDINETQHTTVDFPVLADADRTVATLYDMIHPNASDTLTVRSVFVIDPQHKVRATFAYPASTGRNFDEILRLIDSLQLTDRHGVATPANWTPGEDVIIPASLQDPAVLREKFPKGYTVIKPYLRTTPQPD